MDKTYLMSLFLAPIFTSLSAIIFIYLDIYRKNCRERQLKFHLLFFFGCTTIAWFGLLSYWYAPSFFVSINALFFCSILLLPVVFYRFIFEITITDTLKSFTPTHYIFPVALPLILLVLSIIVPYQIQVQAVEDKRGSTCLFFLISNNKNIMYLFFSTIYSILSIFRLEHYRKFLIHHVSNSKVSLWWMYLYCIFAVVLPFIFFISRNIFYQLPWMIPIFILLFVFQYAYLSYSTIKRNNMLSDMDTNELPFIGEECSDHKLLKKEFLQKKQFEEYMSTEKPYLNPNLKITDLVADLHMNRTYISGFINREYNMNFSRYINHYRMTEYRRMRQDPELKDKDNKELSALAGFSSYRYFLQVEKG